MNKKDIELLEKMRVLIASTNKCVDAGHAFRTIEKTYKDVWVKQSRKALLLYTNNTLISLSYRRRHDNRLSWGYDVLSSGNDTLACALASYRELIVSNTNPMKSIDDLKHLYIHIDDVQHRESLAYDDTNAQRIALCHIGDMMIKFECYNEGEGWIVK